ncbi:hypothetical protein CTAM01_08868 [Colletotrichum tamarilloi]|uniref:Zn(2)-C6 fungal-type domain-containing protein n=1 Tax=Colletotrichum tamarilloi TaxID=1209934 RepID=A0ABQ9R564_9PEZI|nr:uncharacterized protein CTAM01_08868 [Colletotrichum tamarilloi]KAK1494855.1 hypothetical protein CTAM01_08868 [Colletotrichum tamarilloi]
MRSDDQQPRCSRCEKRNVECFRPERRPSFRQGSTANYDGAFSREQRWVNSRPRAFRFDSRAPNSTPTPTQEKDSSNDSPFDLCDEERHFQLVVVRRARSCQPLRDAIFAVAARHLCRHPKFRSEPGGGGVVVYQRQLLPDLTPQSAFEYMLRCIPALHEVSSTQDEEYRENLAAAALILRQFEEMDPEESQSAPSSDFGTANGDGNGTSYGNANSNVNFIDITKAILRAAPSSRWSGLLSAVYWVAVRQEIYFALTLGRSPQITARPDQGREVSFANRLIWFMSEVAKWKMGDRIEGEWERLRVEESILAVECTRQFIPIMQRPADRSQGENFPLVWYGSDVEVTALQHFILARMILLAEDPSLQYADASLPPKIDSYFTLRFYESFMIFEDYADNFGLPVDKSPTGEHIERPNIKSEK